MYCVAIQDEYHLVIDIYGPYANDKECLIEMDKMFKNIPLPDEWRFRIFPMLK